MRGLDAAFAAAADDPEEPRVSRLSTLDLSAGPVIGRVRAAFGFGWQAREWVRRVEQASDVAVDAVVEACPGDRHHLLGLGRLGVPSVRWTMEPAGRRWVDRLAAQEGTPLLPDAVVPDAPELVVRACLDALDEVRAKLASGVMGTPVASGKP